MPQTNHRPQETIKLLHLPPKRQGPMEREHPQNQMGKTQATCTNRTRAIPSQEKDRCNLRTTYPSSALNSAVGIVARLKPRVGQVARKIKESTAKEGGEVGRGNREQVSKSGRQEEASCLSRRCLDGKLAQLGNTV